MKREIFYDKYADSLEGEYKEAYKTVERMLALLTNEFSPLESNMSEIVDLLLSAQEESRPVNSVLGDDLYGFCCELVKGTKFSIKEWLIQLSIRTRFLMILFLFMSIADFVFPVEGENVSIIVLYGCIVLAVLPMDRLISYLSFKFGKYIWKQGKLILYVKAVLYFLILGGLWMLLPENAMFMQVSDLVPLEMDIVILSLLLCFVTWLKKQRKKITSLEENIKFSELVFDDDFIEKVLKNEEKAYAKYLRKCNKKEKVTLDIVSWHEKKLKEVEAGYKWGNLLYIIFIVAMLLGFFFAMEFETTIDLVVFVGIQIIVQVGILFCIGRFNRKLHISRREVHEKIVEVNGKE